MNLSCQLYTESKRLASGQHLRQGEEAEAEITNDEDVGFHRAGQCLETHWPALTCSTDEEPEAWERNAVCNSPHGNIRGWIWTQSTFHSTTPFHSSGKGVWGKGGLQGPLSPKSKWVVFGLICSFREDILSQSRCLRVALRVDMTWNSENRYSHIKLEFIETPVEGNTIFHPL